MQVAQEAYDLARALCAEDVAEGRTRFEADVQSLVFGGQFGTDFGGEFVQALLYGGKLAVVQGDGGVGFARDGVAEVAGLQADDFERVVRVVMQHLQDAGEDFDGVAALQVDFHAGVSALEAADVQLVALSL